MLAYLLAKSADEVEPFNEVNCISFSFNSFILALIDLVSPSIVPFLNPSFLARAENAFAAALFIGFNSIPQNR